MAEIAPRTSATSRGRDPAPALIATRRAPRRPYNPPDAKSWPGSLASPLVSRNESKNVLGVLPAGNQFVQVPLKSGAVRD